MTHKSTLYCLLGLLVSQHGMALNLENTGEQATDIGNTVIYFDECSTLVVGEGSWTWQGTDCSDREGERNHKRRKSAGVRLAWIRTRHLQNMLTRAIQGNVCFIQHAEACRRLRMASPLCDGREQLFAYCPPARCSPLPSPSGLRQHFAATRDTALHHSCPRPAQIKYFPLLAPKSRLHAPPCRLMGHHGRAVPARTKVGPQALQHQDERKCSATLVLRSAW